MKDWIEELTGEEFERDTREALGGTLSDQERTQYMLEIARLNEIIEKKDAEIERLNHLNLEWTDELDLARYSLSLELTKQIDKLERLAERDEIQFQILYIKNILDMLHDMQF